MTGRTLVNLSLLGAVAVLSLVAFYEPGIEPAPLAPRLTETDPAGIARIVVEGTGGTVVRLERRENRWWITEPYVLPANVYRAESLTDVLAADIRSTIAGDDLPPSRFGLDPPRASLVLDDRRIDFGDTDPLNGDRYVLLDGSVHLIRDRYFHHLAAAPAEFADSALLGDDPQPRRISLPGLVLTKEDGAWRISPDLLYMSADEPQRLASAWIQARAMSVEAYSEAEPSGEISVLMSDRSEPLVFQIVADEDDTLFARPDAGVQYRVPHTIAREMLEARTSEPETTTDGASDASANPMPDADETTNDPPG